jgi:hypothetical protein
VIIFNVTARAMRRDWGKWPGMALVLSASMWQVQCNGDTTEVACLTDLSTTDAGRTVQRFIETANVLLTAAHEIDFDMLNVCRSMATDLGIPSPELEPSPQNANSQGAATEAACRRVRAEIDKIIHDDLPRNAHLAIVATSPVCTVDAEAQWRCEQQCDPVTVAVTHLECTPGKFYGQCMGACMGTCTSSCAATCTGSCTGICSGTCTGSCNGMCDGLCSARNTANGVCYGSCDGSCTGICDGSCVGTCDATCHGSCDASCVGTCEGSCSVWVQPPTCTQVQEITAVPECKTNCIARARFGARCTDPVLTVTSGYAGTPAQQAALQRLMVALRHHYGRALKVGFRATKMVQDAAGGFVTTLGDASTTARQVGLGAAVCVADAVTRVAGAVATVNVSVNVSVSFTASVSAMGGAAL